MRGSNHYIDRHGNRFPVVIRFLPSRNVFFRKHCFHEIAMPSYSRRKTNCTSAKAGIEDYVNLF